MNAVKKIKISNANKHLKDIFTSNLYLEIGSISYQTMDRLLKNELVLLEDTANFSIQNIGIGKSNIENENLRNLVPYLFFENINHKNGSLQLLLTYGLVTFKDTHNKEYFAPLVLLPVKIYLTDNNCYFKLIAKPIENQIVLKLLAIEKKIVIPTAPKLDTLNNIDKYVISFEQYEGVSSKLENYLTYAYVQSQEIRIDHDKYDTQRLTSSIVNDYMDTDEINNFECYTKLNEKQRQAIINANSGNSFVIVGRMGTGKTQTLENITINQVIQGKKILYISNMSETLKNVQESLNNKGFQSYVANLVDPLYKSRIVVASKTINYNVKNELNKYYKDISLYEKNVASRILDFRYLDILEELSILQKEEKNILAIDDLSLIYKHEYYEIISALKEIQKAIDELVKRDFPPFKESPWKEIPISNSIKYPNQITSLIFQINKCFKTLLLEKEILEKDFGFTNIQNYALLKNVINTIKAVNILDVPSSWKDVDNKVFENANNEFKNLKNQIYHLQEIQYFIKYKYDKLTSINIYSEIKTCLGSYFQITDNEKIDTLQEKRSYIVKNLNKAIIEREVFIKTVNKIRKLMNWNFDYDNIIIEELLSLTDFLNKHYYHRKWLNYTNSNKLKEVLRDISLCNNFFNKYYQLEGIFNKYFGKTEFVNLEELINLINEYEKLNYLKNKKFVSLNTIRKKYKLTSFNDILNSLNELKKLHETYNDMSLKYIQLTGNVYNKDCNIIEQIKTFYNFINSINNKDYKKNIVKFMQKDFNELANSDQKSSLQVLNLFAKSIANVNELYETILPFGIKQRTDLINQKLDDLYEIYGYIQALYQSNDRMLEVIRKPNKNYVCLNEYIDLMNELDELKKVENYLTGNDKYQYLYGKLYNDTTTNINSISRLLQNYQAYYSCFSNPNSLINSLEASKSVEISEHLNICNDICNNINEIFKLYGRIFNDGVSRYYYNDFEETISYLDKLLDSRDELILYLDITNGLKVLIKNHLHKFMNYIINNVKVTNLEKDFKYTYFSNAKEIFLKNNPKLMSIDEFKISVENALNLEDDLFEYNRQQAVEIMRKQSKNKNNYNVFKKLDFDKYVKRNILTKRIFLADTQTLNYYLDINDFDLVIIDDAHLLNSNEYYLAVDGKQVIIAGELQLHSSISNNLISRLHYNNIVQLTYRYTPTPKSLLINMSGLQGVIKPDYDDNSGIIIIKEALVEKIVSLVKENKDYIINIFLSGATEQRNLFESLTKGLLKAKFSDKEIYNILRNNINISDLLDTYLYNSDYNIVNLNDYYSIDTEHISANLVDNLLLCSKKLIIYDNKQHLASNKNSAVLRLIRNIVNSNNEPFQSNVQDQLLEDLKNLFVKYGFVTYESHDDIDLLISRNNKVYGIMIFWDANNSRIETLNHYRDYCKIYQKNGIMIYNIFLSELAASFEEVVIKISDKVKILEGEK